MRTVQRNTANVVDFPLPVPANPEPEDDLPLPVPATPQVMEELPSKSDFDNLLGVGSSDVTVEVLEDTLDTSELEATFVADQEFGDLSDGNDGRVYIEHGHYQSS